MKCFEKSNLSIQGLRGSVIECSVEQMNGEMAMVDTGLKTPTVLFRKELYNENNKTCLMGIEEIEIFGEPKIVLPKTLEKIRTKRLIWDELTKIWRSNKNCVRGFILNAVNGGYAVAIAGHIAFLPKSLCKIPRCFRNQWRTFSILNMNVQIGNIVVKEVHVSKNKTKKI